MAGCCDPIPTVGLKLYVDDATEGTPDVEIGSHMSIAFSGAESSEIDTTALCDDSRQYLDGLKDDGTADIAFNTDYSNDGQNLLRSVRGTNAIKSFKLLFKDGRYVTGTASVRTSSLDFGLDTKVESSMSLRVKSQPQVFSAADVLIGNA